MTTIKASEVQVGDVILSEFNTELTVTMIDHIDTFVLISGTSGIARVGLPALNADAPVELLSQWRGGAVGGRGERDSEHGWENPRDAEEGTHWGTSPHDEARLTEDERYGVQYNVNPGTIGE